ncbi:SDR family oxidoreductase [Kytococcus sedentarius]|uniref:SDR family oxidoreductase n=1 Tax=Kytococcus sedentarius TaxID=1276 RepID=UPI001951FC4A|nr:SDR family oxidoreductase [Kytococcus sedentarius]QRO87728.1 SDR family oxidoreductase [Kytococcus sedentarius]
MNEQTNNASDSPAVDPVTRFESITPPEQDQDFPGLDTALDPVPDLGEDSYRGSGRLEGMKALVTGGDSGIGAAVAIAYAREGADVAINHLPAEQSDADRIIALIEAEGRTAVSIPSDLTTREACDDVIAQAVEGLGGLDILVSNAGKQVSTPEISQISDEQFDLTMKTNVYAMFWLCRAAVDHLGAGSSIIITTSVQAYSPSEHLLDYATTKAAENAFGKALSKQLAPKGIRVNLVAPGPIWTVLQAVEGQPKEKLPKFGKDQPLGRAGQPAELASAYVFLASPEASYVVGETLNVNGGADSP